MQFLHSSASTKPSVPIRILMADRNRMGSQRLAESLDRDPWVRDKWCRCRGRDSVSSRIDRWRPGGDRNTRSPSRGYPGIMLNAASKESPLKKAESPSVIRRIPTWKT